MPSTFVLQSDATIDAPAHVVYNLLTDLSTWHEWNAFVPSVDIKKEGASEVQPSDSRSKPLQLGQHVHFHVHFPIRGKYRKLPGGSVEEITHIDAVPSNASPDVTTPGPKKFEVTWCQVLIPRVLLRTKRINTVEQGTEGQPCIYRTYMTFDGPFAWFVKIFVGSALQKEFDAWARNLKDAAEQGRRGGEVRI